MPFKRPCPKNGTEDKIMNCTLGLLKHEDFTTARQRIKFYNHEDQVNHTSLFHGISLDHSVFVSPVLVASAVIGMIVAISCVTIIVGSLRRSRRSGDQQDRRHRHQFEDSQESDEPSIWSRGMRYACSFMGDWPAPSDLTPGEEANAMVLRELHGDAPPRYEDCMGPGATQQYLPTDAPPPYSVIDSNPRGNQQAQNGLRTISMDALPTYEAACEANPPSSLLPLPGPEPGPSGRQGSPERAV